VKILVAGGGTGGHLMPALALARALRDAQPGVEPVMIGAERGIEAEVLPRYPFRFELLPIEPLYRHAWWRNIRWPFLAWGVWRRVGALLARERPEIVVGTGGYAAGPVVWRAQREGLPTAIQEQNAYPGITTRWLARDARQIHLGFAEARERLHPGKETTVFALGNPIRPPEPGDRAAACKALGVDPARRTLLVFGGSQGARALNYALAAALEHGLLADVNVIWGTGAAHIESCSLLAQPGRVVVHGFLDPLAPAYRAADLVVCRAGAMTTAELCAWGKPSVLVPLPSAAADHQTVNARALEAAGAAVVLPEKELTHVRLAQVVGGLLRDANRLTALAGNALARGRPTAARDIATRILTLNS